MVRDFWMGVDCSKVKVFVGVNCFEFGITSNSHCVGQKERFCMLWRGRRSVLAQNSCDSRHSMITADKENRHGANILWLGQYYQVIVWVLNQNGGCGGDFVMLWRGRIFSLPPWSVTRWTALGPSMSLFYSKLELLKWYTVEIRECLETKRCGGEWSKHTLRRSLIVLS